MAQRIETKVIVGALGGGAGGVVSTFALWLLGASLWHAGFDAGQVQAAMAAVPSPVADVVPLVLTSVGAFLGGYLAPHTSRPDLAPPAPPAPQAIAATPAPAPAPSTPSEPASSSDGRSSRSSRSYI